jgi:cytochrome c oxidase subunit 4
MASTRVPETPERVEREGLPAEDISHPEPRQYVMVGVVLAVLTLLEVALFYVDFIPDGAVIASLLVLMTLKFALVALWFMHLKFDSPIYKRLFVTGLVLALSVFVIVLLTFGVFIS